MDYYNNSSIHQHTHHSVNPWEQDNALTVSVRNALIQADQMGFETLQNNSASSNVAKKLADLPSSKLMSVLKEISGKNITLSQMKRSVSAHQEEKEFKDIIHLDIIEKSINIVKDLCSHFDSILKNTDMLVNRLQKPMVGDYLKIEARYHEKARELFTMIVPTFNDLSLFLDNITWMANNDLSAAQLESLSVSIQSLTASVETQYSSLLQMRRGVDTLVHPPDHTSAHSLTTSAATTISNNSLHSKSSRSAAPIVDTLDLYSAS